MADPYLYERVYTYVLEEVRSGALSAGARVPSEKELSEQFGVSRITSKRALHMLAEAGVLVRQRGRGTFVAADPPPLDGLLPGAPKRPSARSTSCIALVIPDASDAYGLELLCAIEERCAELGFHLLVRRSRDSQEIEEQAIEVFHDGLAAGLIVFPVHGEFYNTSLVRLVLDRAPLVLVDRYLPGIPACAVHTDNLAAARELTGHLLDQGHSQLAFLSPPVEHTSSIEDRLRGFEAALRERGLPADAGHRFCEFHSTLPGMTTEAERATHRELERAAIRDFVKRRPEVTGFVACEYNIAVLLSEVLAEKRASRRNQLIACFDSPDSPDSRSSFPYIKQGQQAMGRKAVDLLIAQLSGEPVPLRSQVPYRLIVPSGAESSR